MSPEYRGIDGDPNDIDINFKASDKNPYETEVNVPQSDFEAIESEKKPDTKKTEIIETVDLSDVNIEDKDLQEVDKENPEGGIANDISEVVVDIKELTPDEIEKESNKRAEQDIKKKANEIMSEDIVKKWKKTETSEKIGAMITTTEKSFDKYRKDIMEERGSKTEKEVSDIRWNRELNELNDFIKDKKWDKVIQSAGHMNNLDSKKFKELQEDKNNPFNDDVKTYILREIENMRYVKGDAEEAGLWKLAEDIAVIADCLDFGKKRIEISKEDLERLNGYLNNERNENKVSKEVNELGTKGSKWMLAQLEKNLKTIEKLGLKKIIKIVD